MATANYYERLDLSRDAGTNEIKRNFHTLALTWHPDKNPGREEECREKFVYYLEAYEVLSDATKRRRYDRSLRLGTAWQSHRGFADYDDIFEEFRRSTATWERQMDDLLRQMDQMFQEVNDGFDQLHRSMRLHLVFLFIATVGLMGIVLALGAYKMQYLGEEQAQMVMYLGVPSYAVLSLSGFWLCRKWGARRREKRRRSSQTTVAKR